ncbi:MULTISPECIES: WXG100 family type VII secretion target [Streptomyces]|nr:WXG100 family type VII secretion target [Streptomyces nigrescens]MEE4418864.1 WXG100 family type VII secretion target [Streptomyces sp. DSM 41528]
MDSELSVDTDGLEGAVPHIREIAGRAESVLKNLEGELKGVGKGWDDPMGRAFVEGYQGPAETLQRGLADISHVVTSTADGVHTMGKSFANTEYDVLDAIRTHGVPRETGHPSVRSTPSRGRG